MTLNPAHTARLHPVASHESLTPRPQQQVLPPTSEAVACRAFLPFQNHGEASGRDVQDWLQAEAELKAESL
ncbi:MAG: DUF2934 domain-containing protein, partial [Prosthecobacter sp.]|uniref:DUF2934 domain-containing protein n=1 Tax=Prosthecobacter sp. TaxID=1965333 RepID=UPI003BB19B8F